MSTTTNTGPTLTQMTHIGRLTVKFGLVGLVSLMVLRLGVGAFTTYWKATHPEPPPPPTVGFGVLPHPVFESQADSSKPSSYELETATGRTPDFGDRAKVFFMPQAAPNLLADEEAKKLASLYGYKNEPEILSTNIYRWSKTQPLQTTFDLNILTHHFELTTDFQTHPELLVDQELPTNFEAVDTVKSYLKSAQLLPDDVATAAGEITPLKSLGGELTEAVSVSDADFLQIDLNRNPINDTYEMYSPEGHKGVISAIITGKLKGKDSIVSFDYNYNPVDYTQVHTYPIMTSQNAWKVLQAGEGYIVSAPESQKAVIRNISLGYYDSFDEQEYLQPIYVFEGDDGFLGYVPAITSKFLQSQLPQ